MVTGWSGGGSSLFLGSDGDPSDPVLFGLAAAFFPDELKTCCGVFLEAAVLVRFHGGICAGLWSSSICALPTQDVKGLGAISCGKHRVVGRPLPAAPAITCIQDDGVALEFASLLIHAMALLLLSCAQPGCCCLEQSVVLQGSLHMRDPHCSTRLEAVMQGMCSTVSVCDGHDWKMMLDGDKRALLYVSNERHFLCSLSCTCLSVSHDRLVEDAVSTLFGLCHQRWTTTPLLLILRFNSGDTLSLSSVKDTQYLQLNSIPRVYIPDRPLGEPPAGHQLDRTSIEALEDCKCGNIESGLSTDERSPFGSICDLQHLLHELRSFSCGVVHLGTYLSCSTVESHVMMYLDP